MFKTLTKKVIQNVRQQNAVRIMTIPKKSPKELFQLWLKDKVYNFCQVTSLHGYIHTINKDYHFLERWLWIFMSFLALIAAIVLLWISFNWNLETPTTTVIESTNYATYNLPFPSVTICNLNKMSKTAVLEVAKNMKRLENSNITDEDLAEKLKLLLHFRGSGTATDEAYKELDDIMQLNNENVNYLLDRLTPKCTDMLERCMWKGSLSRCDSLFQKINSSDGICCSFNNYAYAKGNYDPKIISSIPKQPRRVTACGYQTGLSLLLRTDVEDYHATEVASTGFRLMIHNSYDFADANSVVKLVPAKTEAYLSIAPESTYSTNDVFDLDVDVRNCLIYSERTMDTLLRYSYVNCMAECRSAIAFDLCKCVPFTLPNNGSLPKCKVSQVKCIRERMSNFAGSVFDISNDTLAASQALRKKCKCLPDCTFYSYPAEISTGTLVRDFSFNSLSFFKDVNLTDQTLIHVFFNDLIATHYRKDMYQNWLGILAAFGGLLGLFLGFSLVTGFELIYFFTIRTFFDGLAAKTAVAK